MSKVSVTTVKDIGCSFKVIRSTSSHKVITLSLWKSSPGYVFNLSNTILWWGRNARALFPGWNVRIYIDYSIFHSVPDDIDWNVVYEQLSKHKNVEIWLYFCEWGHSKDSKCARCHDGTFGSVLRFHAFQDPDVDIAISRNVELLSSIKDARIVHDWSRSKRKYHVIYDVGGGYPCDYKNEEMCKELGMDGENMVLATFGMKKPNPYKDMFYLMRMIVMEYGKILRKYPYGTDEILLTTLYKIKMTGKNTYITPRARLNQLFPLENPHYEHVAHLIFDFFREDKTPLTGEVRGMVKLFGDYMDFSPYLVKQLPPLIGIVEDKVPDVAVALLKYLRKELRPKINIRQAEKIRREMMQWSFELFRDNKLNKEVHSWDEPDYNFMDHAKSSHEADTMTYVAILTVIFELIDYPGITLKMKTYDVPIMPKEREITEKEIQKAIELKKRTSVIKKTDEQWRERIVGNLKRDYEREVENYNKNKKIFDRNLKNIWILQDDDYL
uniref:Uncharacterized protein n=1 Tax=viral metagenome TaxID=1070528 RepID=A0A6C0EK71_9ZZZZ